MIAFGEILAELRQDRKMTQKDLAQAMFVTVGTISNYENGVHYPDVEKLISLADYFLDVHYFFLLNIPSLIKLAKIQFRQVRCRLVKNPGGSGL